MHFDNFEGMSVKIVFNALTAKRIHILSSNAEK